VSTETLTGAPAIQKAISSTFELETLPTPTLVHFRVTEQGVTLTDVQRRYEPAGEGAAGLLRRGARRRGAAGGSEGAHGNAAQLARGRPALSCLSACQRADLQHVKENGAAGASPWRSPGTDLTPAVNGTRHGAALREEAAEAPSLETFQARLDGALSNVV